MHALHQLNHRNTLEIELLSNSKNQQEYLDAKKMFHSLKAIRRQEKYHLNNKSNNTKPTFKNIVLHFLFASSYTPVHSIKNNIISQNHHPFNVGLPCNINISSTGAESAVDCPGPYLTVLPDVDNSGVKLGSGLVGKKNAGRTVRSAELAPLINLPPFTLAFKGLASLLTSGSLIAANQLESPHEVIKTLVAFLMKNDDALKTVTKSLLETSGLYGYKEHEDLTQCNQQKIMGAWINLFVFDGNIEKFIVNEFIKLSKDDFFGKAVATQAFAYHICNAVDKVLKNASSTYGVKNHANPSKFIIDNLLRPLMPTLFYSGTATVHSVGSIEWGFLHAGLVLAQSADINLETLSLNGILSLGIILESMLKEGFTTPSLIKLFIIPATLYHVKYCHDNHLPIDKDELFVGNIIKQNILTAYFLACDSYHAINDPIARLSQRVDTYQSFEQLKYKLENLNSGIKIIPEMYYFSYYNYSVYGTPSISDENERKNTLWHIPDAGLLFENQNIEIADAFANVDQKVIRDAFHGIKKNETQFLHGSVVIHNNVQVEYESDFQNQGFDKIFPQIDELKIRENVDVFSAEKGNEKRIFALIKEEGEYQLRKISDNITSYFDYLKYFKPDLNTGNIKLRFSQGDNGKLKEKHDSLQLLAENLAQIHRDKMLEHLNACGDENAADVENNAFFSSLIPFYTCSRHEPPENNESTKAPCGLNVTALSAIVGKPAKNIRTATELEYRAQTDTDGIASGLAARYSFALEMKGNTSYLIKTIDLPASRDLNSVALSKLGVGYLVAFDPSLEINSRLSEFMFKQIVEGISIASRTQPVLKKLLAVFQSKKIESHGKFIVNQYKMAYLSSLELEVPVVKVGGDTFNGKDIYLRLNPENNDFFSRKYTLAEDNTLIPVPMPQGENLHNFLLHDNEEQCAPIAKLVVQQED